MMRNLFLLLVLPVVASLPWKGAGERVAADDPWLASVACRSFAVEVSSVGDLEAANSLSICSTLPSDLGKVIYLIPDGSIVEAGDLLARIDPAPFDDWITDLQAKVAAQEATVESAQQGLAWEYQQAELEAETLALELRTAEMELEKVVQGDGPTEIGRLEEEVQKGQRRIVELRGYLDELQLLAQEGFLSEAELAQCGRELNEAEEQAAQARLKRKTYSEYTLPMLVHRAETALERHKMRQKEMERSAAHKKAQAAAALEHAKKALLALQQQLCHAHNQRQATEIRAPRTGMVVLAKTYRNGSLRQPQVGDLLTMNQPLIELPDLAQMRVRTQVRELDLHKIAVGTPVTVAIDAYPDLRLPGRVSRIGILALADRTVAGGKAFGVSVTLDRVDPRLRPGMTAEVTFHAHNVENKLSVPVHALFHQGPHTFCYRANEGRFEPVEVCAGVASNQWVVVEGLDEGDRVCTVLPPDER